MSAARASHALFPGTFDPLTAGHLDLVERASALFERVTIAVAQNPDKSGLFSVEERLTLIAGATTGLSNVECTAISGLVVHACEELGCGVIVRGARHGSDYDYELQMATTNRALTGIETIVLAPTAERLHISSTLVRQVASMGGDVSAFVPPNVLAALNERFSH